ncbi:TetR/AcrR family transcriptional regulator C-terminal domain-containing protein [Eubacteriaceae bacterium Marseille-Q4139]|nr:TetR/AcrR family transcriptional regulator C-terminal domain-containing protein [Eubacteriaceae bacterium Marseille-Q4139]
MTNMKDTIRNALVSKLQSSSLDSITVTDIATDCGISRQAFYYYFNDIYDVVESIFLEQTERALNEYSDIDSWQIGYIRMMRWTLANKSLVMNTYRSIQREYIEFFMYRVLYQYIIQVVQKEARPYQVTTKQCEFIADFYTLAINAVSLEWIRNGMKEPPEEIAENVNFLIEGDFQKALIRFDRQNRQ